MKPGLLLAFSLSLVFPLRGAAQTTDADALKLLNEVTQKYAKATRSQIESVTESRRTDDLSSSWRKVFLTAYEAPEDHYKFGGTNSSGSEFVVSDGTAEWELHEAYGEYVKRPAGSFGHPFPQSTTVANDIQQERNAHDMRRMLGLLGTYLKTAHARGVETIQIGDRRISCFVISFGPEDYPEHDPGVTTYEEKIWIDQSRKLIVKTERTSEGRPLGTTVHGMVFHNLETVTYPLVTLDEPIPEDAFTFTPPADAKLVDKFTDPFAKYRPAAPTAAAVRPTPPQPNYVGSDAPNLVLTAADGTTLDLATLRGRPVLLDLWATWCGPCLLEMPTIDRIHRYGKQAGLVVLGIDQDKNPADALAYLKKENYGWADYHDGKDGKYNGVGLKVPGMPAMLLIGADGKIAYLHSGADDEQGLVTAVRRLGPAFAAAMDAAEK
jgi:thiol-disulfide isomerase/thioredoxin